MANVKILHWRPNATCIPLTRVGVSRWVMQILAFLDTNMLVSQMRNCGVGLAGPNANGFASQWNIGLTLLHQGQSLQSILW